MNKCLSGPVRSFSQVYTQEQNFWLHHNPMFNILKNKNTAFQGNFVTHTLTIM